MHANLCMHILASIFQGGGNANLCMHILASIFQGGGNTNLCMHILASIFQDGSNSFPAIRLPVLNSVTDLSRHTLLLPPLHR